MKKKSLSPMEARVLEMAAAGYGTNEIAKKFRRSPNTIATHLTRLKLKLKARSTIHAAVIWATRNDPANEEYQSWFKSLTA